MQTSVRAVIPTIPPESFAVHLTSNAARESLEHTLMQTTLIHRLLSPDPAAAAPAEAMSIS